MNIRFSRVCRFGFWLLLTLFSFSAIAASVEQETLVRLDRLRAIRADADRATIDGYNRQMDEAWKYFSANKNAALPVLRNELTAELRKDKPSHLLLLDIGYFLRQQEGAADKALAKQAFVALDFSAPIVRMNQQQLFEFGHTLATEQDPQLLTLFDKAFLRDKVTAYIPQHALRLDETLVCVFLYGLYGPAGERHLQPCTSDPQVGKKTLEILAWIGSPESVPAVTEAMNGQRDFDLFARATAFMMKVGGPEGRTAMLRVAPQRLDDRSQSYYLKVRPEIEKVSFDQIKGKFNGMPGPATLADAELKKRLTAMYANYGRDDKTNPAAVINSGLPKEFLINELVRIRTRMFYRVSNEGLSDVEMTNALINALRFRGR